jgi:YqaJ-like viral recombinase domain
LYGKPLTSQAVQYGIVNETKATTDYERITGNHVEPCELFVPYRVPYLGASPDGLVGDDGLLEVKCIPSVGQQSVKEAAKSKSKKNLSVTYTDGTLQLKPKHPYWFQIQGQLNITGREWCDLVLYSDGGVDVRNVSK